MSFLYSQRLTSPLLLGNTLKGIPSLPSRVSSSIIPPEEEEEIRLFIASQKSQSYLITVNKGCLVEDLSKKIAEELQEDFEYISFQQRLMHRHNTLFDEGLYDSCQLHLRKNVSNAIKIAIKFHGTDHELDQLENLSHRCSIISLKKKLESILKLNVLEIILLDSRQNVLDNEKSLSDYGIYKSCSLFFKPFFIMGVKDNCNILTRDARGKLDFSTVDKIDRNTQIISMDMKINKKVANKNCEITPIRSRTYNQIQLQNGLSISFIGSCYFYTEDKGWLICQQGLRNSLRIGDKILMYNKNYLSIQNIYYDKQEISQSTKCFSIRPSLHSSYFINDILICEGKHLSILYEHKLSCYRYIHLSTHEGITIAQLKARLEQELNISIHNRQFYSQQLDKILTDEIIIKDIQSTIYLSLLSTNISELLKDKKIVVIFDQDIKEIKIDGMKDRSIQQVILSCFNDKVKECPYFGVLYKGKLIDTKKNIKEFHSQNIASLRLSKINLLVTRFPQKIRFQELLKVSTPQRTNQSIFQKISSIFRRQSTDPIVNYLQNYLQKQTQQILHTLHLQQQYQALHNTTNTYISELTKKLKAKQPFFNTCYRVSSNNIKNLFVKDTVISIREFFSCSSSLQKANSYIDSQERNLLLHIKSITGRAVRKQGVEQQIVFLPYTYFLVTKIEEYMGVIHVYLSELPVPTTFHENIVVWVDDRPQNNIQLIQKKDKFHTKTEVVLLTSTELAKFWFYHFGKVINQLKIKLRLITDMVRYEQTPQNAIRKNFYAGIDLIEYLFNQCGYTTPVLVFCSAFEQGRDNIKRRQVDQSRYSEVTNSWETVYNFLNFGKI